MTTAKKPAPFDLPAGLESHRHDGTWHGIAGTLWTFAHSQSALRTGLRLVVFRWDDGRVGSVRIVRGDGRTRAFRILFEMSIESDAAYTEAVRFALALFNDEAWVASALLR